MNFNLLQHTKDLNEKLFIQGVISKQEYLLYEKQLQEREQLFKINLN